MGTVSGAHALAWPPHRPKMTTAYVVSSFDFGGSSAVQLHVVTDDRDRAEAVYSAVLAECDASEKRDGVQRLVELTPVAMDTRLDRTLYWGPAALNNNNTRAER
jgi:hypothetical protein